MVEKYNYFFDLYLRSCRAAYDPEHPYDNLEKCIRLCGNLQEQLIGMVKLIAEIGEFTREAADKEIKKLLICFPALTFVMRMLRKAK